ncbi:MAG: helix-turn-helix domain-containing protein [Candidatus Delongbacteria bacterium]|nr:helix-turn-helix domain-containing protein [Candidatus Delongbacteria bacterium]
MKQHKMDRDFKLVDAIINKNIKSYTFNVERLCAVSTFCYDKINNLIFLKFGLTIYQYIECKRMINAIILLNQGHEIKYVYKYVGYANAKTFRTAFKKQFKFSPSDFKTYILKFSDIRP